MSAAASLRPVRLRPGVTGLDAVGQDEVADVDRALRLARRLGATVPGPGLGRTAELWSLFATVGAADLGAVRAIEPHLDARAILAEADSDTASADTSGAARPDWVDSTELAWGVFAAEGGDDPVRARPTSEGWRLDGVKPWCSLADRLDAALVTAAVDDPAAGPSGDPAPRRLFAVRLDDRVEVQGGTWHARGLTEIPSGPVRFTGAPAVPIGAAGWYLRRAGFHRGGIGVAACWTGGAVGIARTVREAVRRRPERELTAMHLGAIDEGIHVALLALRDAAERVDAGADAAETRLLAKRVRATAARVAEDVIVRSWHALGPAPLALDAEHAKRVADLELYVRQHHAEADLASLGGAAAESAAW